MTMTESHTTARQQRLMNLRAMEPSARFIKPTQQFEHIIVNDRNEENSWKVKAVEFIHSKRFQRFLVTILIIDVLALFADLFISATFPECHIIEQQGISCCPAAAAAAATNGAQRWLSESSTESNSTVEHYGLCEAPYEESDIPITCDEYAYPALHIIHSALLTTSVIVLSVFFLELSILVIGIGFRHFFNNFFYVLDLFVITVSLGLEILFVVMKNSRASDLVGLLILFRLWRLVRIGHGIFASTIEIAHQEYEILEDYCKACEALLRKSNLEFPTDRPKELEVEEQK